MPSGYSRYPSRRSRSRRGYARRGMFWVRGSALTVTPNITATLNHDLTSDASVDRGALLSSTVTRVRGTIVHSSGTELDPTADFFFFGLMVGDASVLWDPLTMSNKVPWLWWDFITVGDGNMAFGTTEKMGQYRFDVKAQRRITQPGDTLKACYTFGQNAVPAVPFTRINLAYSVLLKD